MKLNANQPISIVCRQVPQNFQTAATKTHSPCHDTYQAQQTTSGCMSTNGYYGQQLSLAERQSSVASYRQTPVNAQDPEQLREAAFKLLKKLGDMGLLPKDLTTLMLSVLSSGSMPAAPVKVLNSPAPVPSAPAPQPTTPQSPAPQPPPQQQAASQEVSKPAPTSAPAKKDEAIQMSSKQVLDVLWRDYTMFATASGKGDKDLITREDLEAIRDQPGISEDCKRVARFLLQNKAAFNALEVRGGHGKHDGQISWFDVRDACNAENLGYKLWR